MILLHRRASVGFGMLRLASDSGITRRTLS